MLRKGALPTDILA